MWGWLLGYKFLSPSPKTSSIPGCLWELQFLHCVMNVILDLNPLLIKDNKWCAKTLVTITVIVGQMGPGVGILVVRGVPEKVGV